jgi:hypothetical protein
VPRERAIDTIEMWVREPSTPTKIRFRGRFSLATGIKGKGERVAKRNPRHVPGASGFAFRATGGAGQAHPRRKTHQRRCWGRGGAFRKRNSRFSPRCLTDLASIVRDYATMKTLAVIFVLALVTIAFEVYSDASLVSEEIPHIVAPDPAAAAIAHGLKHG